jgi:anti-sigma factor RsiW
MMAGWVPSEQELLEYVEGELDAETEERVRRALAASPELADSVAALVSAREALRSAPAFELPEARLQAALESLPRQERERWSLAGLTSSPRRLLLVLTPVAAAAAVAIALTTTLGDGGGGEERTAGKATFAQTEAAAGTSNAAPATSAAADAGAAAPELAVAPVASVAGPPADVAAFLRDQGFRAQVSRGTVEVRGADAQAVQRALEGRAPGSVPVVVLP